jgi:uncharacterized protein YhfF
MSETLDNWQTLESFAFGDSPEMADQLLGFVLSGAKTATCWSVADGPQTHIGKRMVAKDGAGHPRAVIETVSLEQMRFCDVPWSFAEAEGEGDACLEDWRDGHQAYFNRNGGFAPDMLLYCERFRLVETIEAASPPPCGEGPGVGVLAPSTRAPHPISARTPPLPTLCPQGREGSSELPR